MYDLWPKMAKNIFLNVFLDFAVFHPGFLPFSAYFDFCFFFTSSSPKYVRKGSQK
jgi:hypothetical protein